jgi:hypothetical protein
VADSTSFLIVPSGVILDTYLRDDRKVNKLPVAVVAQFEKPFPAAAEAAIGFELYEAAEAAPFQNEFKTEQLPGRGWN